MEISIIFKLIGFFLLLSFSAFFSTSEIALSTLSLNSLRQLRRQYRILVPGLILWQKEPNRVLTTILVGNTSVNMGAGILIASLALDIAPFWEKTISPRYLLLIFSFVATALLIFFGEITPKIYGRLRTDKIVLFTVPFLYFLVLLLRPGINFFISLTNIFLKPFGQKLRKELPFITPQEFKLLLQSEEIDKVFRKEVRLMLARIIDFGQLAVKEVMISKKKIFAVDLSEGKEKIISQIIRSGYSRVPVYKGTLDNILGIIYAKDLLYLWREGNLFLLEDLIRPVNFISEKKKVSELLREFKSGHNHLSVVVNEMGKISGLVTIEDLVEEIIGDISDEFEGIKAKIVVS